MQEKLGGCIHTVEVGALGIITNLPPGPGICELSSERNQGGLSDWIQGGRFSLIGP